MAAPPEIPVKAPAHSPPAHPARLILILSLTPTVGLGIGRFAYSLVLPDMRDALGWSYSAAGFMNTINAAGYLAGALVASRLIRRYGLSAAVFTQTIRHAFRWAEALKVGIVNVNEMSPYWETHIPAGGAAGTSSGIGRTGGRHTLLEMSDLKTVTIDISR